MIGLYVNILLKINNILLWSFAEFTVNKKLLLRDMPAPSYLSRLTFSILVSSFWLLNCHTRSLFSMRPSITVTVEPGLEQGVPWGRDLYTFVTSAAGHMMRTLQKPRKNRPSKRQVNHRRFLHNMIQRCGSPATFAPDSILRQWFPKWGSVPKTIPEVTRGL